MENVELVKLSTYIILVYLLLALFIERTIEVLMAVYNYLEIRRGWYRLWNRRARALQAAFDRLRDLERGGTRGLVQWLLWKVVTDPSHPGGRRAVSARLIRLNVIRVSTRVLAFLLALGLVLLYRLDLIQVVFAAYEQALPGASVARGILEWTPLRIVLTAALISIGAEPLHQLISRLESFAQRKTSATERV